VSRRVGLGISIVWIPLAFLFDGMTALVLPVRLGGDTAAATRIGLISFAGLALATLVQPFAGHLSDVVRSRIDRRAFISLAALPAILGLWLLAGPTTAPVAALGYVTVQLSASAAQAAQQALIPERVSERFRGRAAGLKSAFDVGGAFLAFAVLGTLLASGDALPAAAVTTLILVAALVAMWAFVPARTERSPAPAPTPRSAGLPAGFAPLIAARFLFLFGIYAVGRFLLLLVAERLAIPTERAADETGGLLALFTLTAAAAAIPFGTAADRLGRERTMALGVGLAVAGIAAFVPPAGAVGVIVAGLLMSLGSAAFVSANWAATTDLTTPATAGRVMGIANIGTGGAAAFAGLLGPVVDGGGFVPALLIAAAVAALAGIPLARSSSRTIVQEAA
jgi:MFS family permease